MLLIWKEALPIIRLTWEIRQKIRSERIQHRIMIKNLKKPVWSYPVIAKLARCNIVDCHRRRLFEFPSHLQCYNLGRAIIHNQNQLKNMSERLKAKVFNMKKVNISERGPIAAVQLSKSFLGAAYKQPFWSSKKAFETSVSLQMLQLGERHYRWWDRLLDLQWKNAFEWHAFVVLQRKILESNAACARISVCCFRSGTIEFEFGNHLFEWL